MIQTELSKIEGTLNFGYLQTSSLETGTIPSNTKDSFPICQGINQQCSC